MCIRQKNKLFLFQCLTTGWLLMTNNLTQKIGSRAGGVVEKLNQYFPANFAPTQASCQLQILLKPLQLATV